MPDAAGIEGVVSFTVTRINPDPRLVNLQATIPHGRSPEDGDEIQVPDIGPYADRHWTHLERVSFGIRSDG